MIDPRRVRRWIAGRDPEALTKAELVDVAPIAKVCPHAITERERAEIVKAAKDKRLAALRHRKLTHTCPARTGSIARPRRRCGCSEPRTSCPSTTTAADRRARVR